MKPKIPHVEPKERVSTFRKVLVTFLTLFHLQAIIVCSLSVWLLLRTYIPECSFLGVYSTSCCFLLLSGAFTLVTCTIGIFSTIRGETAYNPRTFGLCIMICFVLNIIAPIVATAHNQDLVDLHFYNKMAESYRDVVSGEDDDQDCWIALQKKHRCCGLNSYEDWLAYNSTSKDLLKSCSCKQKRDVKCVSLNDSSTSTTVRGVPCYAELYSNVSFQMLFLRIFCPIVFILQFVTVSFVLWMSFKLQKANVISHYAVHYRRDPRENSANGSMSSLATIASKTMDN